MVGLRTWLQQYQLAAPPDEGRTIWQEITYRNILRLRVGVVLLSIIAGGLAVSWSLEYELWPLFPQYQIFFWIDVVVLGFMPLFGLALYLHWPGESGDTTRLHDRLLIVFGLLVLSWLAVSSAYEHLTTGNVTHYIIGVFAMAAIFFFRGIPLLLIYLTTTTLFFILVSSLEPGEFNIFRRYDNVIILIPLAWVASRMMFVAYARNIENRLEIEKANRLLQQEITERIQVEEALRASEQKLSLHFDQTPLGAIEWDLEFRVISWNPAAEEIFGYAADEAIGSTPWELILPEESRAHVSGIWKALLEQRGGTRSNNKNMHKNGRLLDCEWYNTPLVAPDGNVIGVSSLVLDVTDRRRAELEKRNLEEKLARSQKMEALGLLAGGVAHDLNNVLSGIVSYPDMLLMEMDAGNPMRRHLEIIQSSGQKAATIVQDLLALARRGVTTQEVICLNDIVSEYLESPEHEKLVNYHPGIAIHPELEENLPNIIGSPVHIRKLVMNLVSNATEAHTADGVVNITTGGIRMEARDPGRGGLPAGDYAVLTVSDSGSGIDSEDLERIFEPFYTKKVMGRSGTGLGMAVVWGTVQDHGGHIEVNSELGKGTEFHVYLPVTREQRPEQTDPLPEEAYRGNGEVILVVDDEPGQREIAERILKRLNYNPITVDSGEAAVSYLETNAAGLVILDMIMDPGIDGLETYRRIISVHPGQKAIITSGYAETDRVKETLALGAGAYVKKPYMMETLGLAVKEELGSERRKDTS